MRRSQQSAFANPVLIGAVTILVAIVAVFLAYNANNGLPFVPTKELRMQIPNGAALVAGNDVREGGYRIGLVSDLKPIKLANGSVGAEVIMKLNKANGNIPVDSTADIVPRSLLGLKMVNIQRGVSRQYFTDGATMPVSQTRVPVQFDDINKMFDQNTRTSVDKDLAGYGDALAGRGSSLNDAIGTLPEFLKHLEPVARYLSAPGTQLSRFLSALNRFMGAVAPVADVNAQLFADQATTFAAIARDPAALEDTIRQSPPTLEVSTDSLRAQQPFLTDLTTFANYMAPATGELRAALPDINPALEAGIAVLPRTPAMNEKLGEVLDALKRLAQYPGSNVALNGLTRTVQILNPMIRYLGPFQTTCDYWNYFWTFLGEHISEQNPPYGYAQRALINTANRQGNNVGAQGATAPANGYQPGDPPPPSPTDAEFLHGQAYGAAIDNAGNADCETGQRGYPLRLNHLDPQGRNLVTDAHTPGDQGPTYHGRPRVPAGETFTREPQTGPQLPYIPQNP